MERRSATRRRFIPTTFAAAQERLLLDTLNHFGWDKRKAAEALGCSHKTVYNLLHKFGYELSE